MGVEKFLPVPPIPTFPLEGEGRCPPPLGGGEEAGGVSRSPGLDHSRLLMLGSQSAESFWLTGYRERIIL